MLSFSIGSAIASLAGALFAHYMFYIEPANFGILRSLTPAFFVIFGGVQTFWGPLLGAIVLTLLPEYARPIATWRDSVYGLVILVMIIWRPQGIISKAAVLAVGDFLRSAPVVKGLQLNRAPGKSKGANENAALHE
ncbi:MAG: branched-chain amino acid ABC transporter permease [Chloroflexi bacterium]|nr:branched-chain amino acid ABC transporter permease [Chloroflexota bacterium]